MHNLLSIFKHDLWALKTNVIAAIVAIGLMIVPPMYAWLTTLGFWDPYSNTGNIQIAVANEDEGYSSSLIPTKIDAGQNIVAALHENKQFDWIFVDADEAIEGAKSGEYYAAIVIPESFTKDLMTVFGGSDTQAKIDYYTNEKENAIAPRVTEAGATALQNQVDETFTKTIANIALSTTTSLSNFLDGSSISSYGSQLLDEMNRSIQDMESAISQVKGFASTIDSTSALLSMGASILDGTESAAKDADDLLTDSAQALQSASGALGNITDDINSAYDTSVSGYDSISSAIDAAYASISKDPDAAIALIDDCMADLSAAIAFYDDVKAELQSAGASAQTMNALESVVSSLDALKDSLQQARESIAGSESKVSAEKDQIDSELNSAKGGLQKLTGSLESDLANEAQMLSSQLSSIESGSSALNADLSSLSQSIMNTVSDLSGNMESMHESLNETSTIMQDAVDDLSLTRDELSKALDDGDLDKIKQIIGNNPEAIASFIAAPTVLEKHAVYEMNSNGSSMSAFYTSLSLWIGAIFLVALTNVNPSKKRLVKLKDIKPWQIYLGRYGVFGLIAIMQGVIVCLGNVFFVGVQCEYFWLYLLACIFCAIVFSNFVYTLTTSFGNIGKAIAIIMLVMQLGGSGGIFPIQMSAPIFQDIYPWLPFAHSMEAFQGCIAGIYGMQYWQSLGMLGLFLVGSLIVGIALRKPLQRLNAYVMDKLDETKLL